MLQRYTVLDATPLLTGQALCLRDDRGRYHVARTTAEIPELGQHLTGRAPSIGFSMLVDAATGQVFRVVFESLACGQLRALELLRGAQPARAGAWQAIQPMPPSWPCHPGA